MKSNLLDLGEAKRVVVVGHPKSGKTTFADSIEGAKIIHSDDYLSWGYVNGLYRLIDDIEAGRWGDEWILEGVLGYRFLRKIEEEGLDIRPDLIVVCETSRPVEEKHLAQIKGLTKIWNDYSSRVREPIPIMTHRN